MKILVRKVGTQQIPQQWPEHWPVPTVGDTVTYPSGDMWLVHLVVWYPEGPDAGEPGDPFVYVVLRADR
jgi:hypothetical protein